MKASRFLMRACSRRWDNLSRLAYGIPPPLKESAHGIFFIVGRQKSDPGSDFSSSQVDAAKLIGSALQKSDLSHIEGLISDGVRGRFVMKITNDADRIANELLDTARALSKHGLLSAQELAQVKVLCTPPPTYTAEKVIHIRTQKAKMSQTVFAGFLNVIASTVQKWESESSGKHPGGAAAKILQLIEKKGIESITV